MKKAELRPMRCLVRVVAAKSKGSNTVLFLSGAELKHQLTWQLRPLERETKMLTALALGSEKPFISSDDRVRLQGMYLDIAIAPGRKNPEYFDVVMLFRASNDVESLISMRSSHVRSE